MRRVPACGAGGGGRILPCAASADVPTRLCVIEPCIERDPMPRDPLRGYLTRCPRKKQHRSRATRCIDLSRAGSACLPPFIRARFLARVAADDRLMAEHKKPPGGWVISHAAGHPLIQARSPDLEWPASASRSVLKPPPPPQQQLGPAALCSAADRASAHSRARSGRRSAVTRRLRGSWTCSSVGTR